MKLRACRYFPCNKITIFMVAIFFILSQEAFSQGLGRSYGYIDGHQSLVNCAVFLLDGKRILTGSNDQTVKLWDLESGLVLKTFVGSSDSIIDIAAVVNETKVLAYAANGRMLLWSMSTGDLIDDYQGHSRILCVSQDGRRVLSTNKTASSELELWDVLSGKTICRYSGHGGPISQALFMKDEKRIVSVSADATMRIWDTEGGFERKKINIADAAGALAISPNEQTIIVGTASLELFFFNLSQDLGAQIDSYGLVAADSEKHDDEVFGIWFIDQNTVLSLSRRSGDGNNLLLWNYQDGKVLQNWTIPRSWVAISRNGPFMTTNGHESESCPIIDIRTKKLIQQLASAWEP